MFLDVSGCYRNVLNLSKIFYENYITNVNLENNDKLNSMYKITNEGNSRLSRKKIILNLNFIIPSFIMFFENIDEKDLK